MTTLYPVTIDGYAQIRVARDRIDEIVAADHNDLRSAVISIEQTLGINPQGPFGTVVARLNDAYSNIEDHVRGFPPRHPDTVIESPAKTGTYHSLPIGSVGSQLQGLLDAVNTLNYTGSGSRTFADGYVLPISTLRNAVSEIVGQIGRITGSTKVGETPYTTSKYSFTSNNVHSQLRSAENYLNENATFLERAFDSFVVEGMAVLQYGGGPSASVAAGYIASNGRLLRYNGGVVVISSPGDYYMYANIVNGVVVVSATTTLSSILNPVLPVVILNKFTTAGGAWSTNTDLRRFGSLINDKNYLTVGNTPVAGSDGYGCDFESLKSAIEYVKTLSTYATQVIAPKKIILVSDITISSINEASILLDVAGIEIDGAGRKINMTVDAPVFVIMADYIHIHDLGVNFNLVSAASVACLANIATIWPPAVTLYGIQIQDCTITKTGSYGAAYFVKCGRAAITDDNLIRDSIFINNIANVEKAGIGFSNTTTISAYVLTSSIISGNKFYQDSFVVSTEPCLRASSSCIIINNTIQGGFAIGMSIDNGISCIICNNIIVGGTTTAFMNYGIRLANSYVVFSDSIVSGNIITNVASYGISSVNNMLGVIISNNIIDNSDITTLATSMVGIIGRGVDDWVIGNRIFVPGSYGIKDAKYVINNYIYGSSSITATNAAICSFINTPNGTISGNIIENVSGIGINGNNCSNLIISNNFLLGNINSDNGIIFVGKDSIISNNIINSYCQSMTSSAIITSIGGTNILITGNQIICPTTNMLAGIYLYDNRVFIINNIFGDSAIGMPQLGIKINNKTDCIINGNIFFGEASGTAFHYMISEIGDRCVINSNYIKDSNNNAIDIIGSDVICCNNRIISAHDYSIYCYDANEPFIYNNIINGSGNDAIYVFNTQYPIIQGNSIFDCYGGGIVSTYYSNYAMIEGNFISNLATGKIAISVNQAQGPSIISNYTTGTYECISATIDAYNVLIANNYSLYDNYGINCGFNAPTNSLITNNYLIFNTPDSSGITIYGGRTSVCNNFIYSGGGPGIQLSNDSPDCLISGNYIENTSAWTAIIINGGCHNTVISNNKLRNLGANGIKLFTNSLGGSDNVIICNNYLDTIVKQGISLVGDCNFCNIFGNYIKDINQESISIYCNPLGYSWGNLIFGNYLYNNVASSNTYSILVQGGTYGTNDNTIIFGNYLLNNHIGAYGLGGIFVEYSDGSVIDNNWIFFVDGNGIKLDYSNYSKISGNYIYYPDTGTAGIFTDTNTNNILVSNNYIYSPKACHGIKISGLLYNAIIGNYIKDVSYNFAGIYISSSCTKMIANNNFVTTFSGVYAFDFRAVDSSSFNGNMCVNPSSGSNGMGLQNCDNTLVVGNYCYGGSGTGSTGFVIDNPTPNITATGNLSRGNTMPTSFGSGNAIDTADCRYVA
jgi:parallel beta-helix repeat protein